jgi:hypothetical protein
LKPLAMAITTTTKSEIGNIKSTKWNYKVMVVDFIFGAFP